MHKNPPTIETCRAIINSPKLRTERSISGGMVSLALAGVWIALAFSVVHVRWIDGMPYMPPWCVIGLLAAMYHIIAAIDQVIVTKQGHALLWFATDYLSGHIAGDANKSAKIHAEQIMDVNLPLAPQPHTQSPQ